jgi:uncharacterized protein YjbI with pentapeptide repeats
MLVALSLVGADVECRMDFSDWEFRNYCDLTAAVFRNAVDMHHSVFRQHLIAKFADFREGAPANFSESTFDREVDISFSRARRESISFTSSVFAEGFKAEGTVGPLLLEGSSCSRDLVISNSAATLIRLDDVQLAGSLNTAGLRCTAFQGLRLRSEAAHTIGPMEVKNDCTFTDARFAKRIRVEVTSTRLDMSGTHFDGGGRIDARVREILLERVTSGSQLVIAGLDSAQTKQAVLSIQSADAGAMLFTNVDMSRCLFYGANDLEGIRIEPTVTLARSPKWRSRRRCVADEFAWRAHLNRRLNRAWKSISPDWGVAGRNLSGLDAAEVASVYRGLRRSFEARGNEPGAADFYYGEMEMRRSASSTLRAERFILSVYWVISGYGLRALRALAWLIVIDIVLAVLLQVIGFNSRDPGFRDALIYTAQSTVSIQSSNMTLTSHVSWAGEILRIVLRLVGPLLLGLALLSVRNRVKR